MQDGEADFARMIEGSEALSEVLGDLEARAGRFGRVLTGALASAVAGGRGLDEILRTAGSRLIDIALSAGLKPLQETVSAGVGSVLGEVAGAVGAGSGGLSMKVANSMRQATARAVPVLTGGGLAAPVFLGGDGLAGGKGDSGAANAALPSLADGGGVAAMTQNVVFNVTARDAESFRKSEGQIAAMLARAVGRGRRGV